MSDDYSTNPPYQPNEPSALAGMALINAMSTASQGAIDVKLPAGQMSPTSLNTLIFAKSGECKTTVDSLVLKHLLNAKNKEGV